MKSNNFEWLLPTPVKGDSWRWGRYAGPLQVEFSPGTITWVTESLVNAEVGQRVLVRFYSGTRATIMGVLGGGPALQIDGRNLALNSSAGWKSTGYGVTGPQKMSEPWVVGETYTVTVKGEVNEGQRFAIWRDSGWIQFGALTHIGNGIHRVTATATETTREAKDEWAIYNYPSTGAEFASIEWIKIERGTKATGWTPAPEDMLQRAEKPLTLKNGWVAYGGSYQAPQYEVYPDGHVQLHGLIKPGTKANNTVIATVPASLAPSAHRVFVVGASGVGAGRVDVRPTGEITLGVFASGELDKITWLSLETISW